MTCSKHEQKKTLYKKRVANTCNQTFIRKKYSLSRFKIIHSTLKIYLVNPPVFDKFCFQGRNFCFEKVFLLILPMPTCTHFKLKGKTYMYSHGIKKFENLFYTVFVEKDSIFIAKF